MTRVWGYETRMVPFGVACSECSAPVKARRPVLWRTGTRSVLCAECSKCKGGGEPLASGGGVEWGVYHLACFKVARFLGPDRAVTGAELLEESREADQ